MSSNESQIVAAVGPGSESDAVLHHAHAIAAASGARLVCCTVTEQPVSAGRRARPRLQRRPPRSPVSDAQMRARIEALTGRGPGDYDFVGLQGAVIVEVLDFVRRRSPSMLIVGASGRGFVICNHARCSVLVARAPTSGAVMAATSLKNEAYPALSAAQQLASQTHRPLYFFHAVHPDLLPQTPTANSAYEAVFDVRVRLAELARRQQPHAEVLAAVGDPTAKVIERAASLPADMVVVAADQRPTVATDPARTTAQRIISHAPCSVFVVRGPSTARGIRH